MTPIKINELSRKMDKDIIERLAEGKMGQELNKVKEMYEEAYPIFIDSKYVKTTDFTSDVEAFKENIVELAPEQQQELYEFMHNKLGLRIYK